MWLQRIDIENETIELDNCDDTSVETLNSRFPTDHARYHLFLYKHSHEGDYLESIGMCAYYLQFYGTKAIGANDFTNMFQTMIN